MSVDKQCSDFARLRADPLAGSSPRTTSWLVIEHPGPWAVDAVLSCLGVEIAAAVHRVAHQHASRVVMIRRPGRDRFAGIRWYRVGQVDRTITSGIVDDAGDLVTEPWAGGGDATEEPLVLLCAHGRHDTCCARHGRPIAAALATSSTVSTYESSHLGGCRFAANALVLPTGDMYGHLTSTDVPLLLHAIATDTVLWSRWRGRADLSPVEQAAVSHAGVSGELERPPAPADITTTDLGDRTRVAIRSSGNVSSYLVTSGLRPAHLLTCRASHESHARAFEVVKGG